MHCILHVILRLILNAILLEMYAKNSELRYILQVKTKSSIGNQKLKSKRTKLRLQFKFKITVHTQVKLIPICQQRNTNYKDNTAQSCNYSDRRALNYKPEKFPSQKSQHSANLRHPGYENTTKKYTSNEHGFPITSVNNSGAYK